MLSYHSKITSEEIVTEFEDVIKGKVFLITGVSPGGLGAECVRQIASKNPALIILAGRNRSKVDETISDVGREYPAVSLRPLLIDLGSFESVEDAASEVNGYKENIDVLINNAAIMATPYFKTADGFESQFHTNHLGHFLFTNLILGKLFANPKSRIINVASSAHHFAPVIFDDYGFSDGKRYDPWCAYGQSKTANILFTRELVKRHKNKGLSSFSTHPGSVVTHLQTYIDTSQVIQSSPKDVYGNDVMTSEFLSWGAREKSLSEGAATQIRAALDPSLEGQSGLLWPTVFQQSKNVNIGLRIWTLQKNYGN